MKTAIRHRWARPILFEGVELPGTAFAIGHLGKEPELSEEASAWLWRFTICAGCTNRDASDNVVRFAGEALDLATRFRGRLLRDVPARFDGPFDAQVIDEWVHSLRTIIDIARSREQCSWTSPDAG
jgi:hypothetical protein